ncbi:phytoene desaturase family protein [Corynebacterium silvaticum]|uniref:Phytoene desaturase family protein n=1 Tax=Corynebacterium silvaticum TaxID=2320431 RepID=A0A7Y4LKZ2_9CORY|nr:phytoene desaturase family protein [Corynebacterium silvaticum]ARU47186.1 phytoene desaturase family protein [Corynebacterium silvaticum]NON70797.1 phytoene desaturase [Corynebacterium silvaticum]UWH01398.1 phytoene desaturase [Corynebacterium silvaticum]UWH03438.1 phytoene desaturase [Corynebacterium silvaticum]UWH05478.1 phytoene desaturase [Corynebacterium silvaticum]
MPITPPKKAIVIGAGAAGLATAALLSCEGYEVTVVEKNEEIGGRAGNLCYKGFRWDTGPSWYLMPDAFEHFFALLGSTVKQEYSLEDVQPAYRLFAETHPAQAAERIDVPSDPTALANYFESVEPGAGEALYQYLASASATYRIAVERFLYTNFTSLGPLLHRDVLGRLRVLITLLTRSLHTMVNKRFQDHRLRQILSYPAVFLSSRPEETPSMYHLMSHTDIVQGVRYPTKGFTGVIEAIYRHALTRNARFLFDTAVLEITTSNMSRDLRKREKLAHATGVVIRHSDGSKEHLHADIVVSCADLHHTETQLLPQHLRSYNSDYFSRRNPGVGTVVVLAGVRGSLPQLKHHNLFFSKDWAIDFDAVFRTDTQSVASESIYVSKPSHTDAHVAPPGHENLFILIPVSAQLAIGHGNAYGHAKSESVRAIAEHAIESIAHKAGIPDLSSRIVVSKTIGPADFADRYHAWLGSSIGPAHTLRQSAFFRGRNVSRKVKNLYYAGATTVPGVGIPMCLISAENVIKRLRGDTSPGPLPEPLNPRRTSI